MKEATGQEKPLYKTLEKLAGDGKASCTGRENRQKLQIETTFDGTRVHPEQTGSITNLSVDNFTPAAFVYGTRGNEQGTLSDVSDDSERNRNANKTHDRIRKRIAKESGSL